MRAYILRRLLLVVPTVFLASLIIFFAIRLIPGSIVDLMVAEHEFYTDVDYRAIEHSLGLDVPVPLQFGRWWGVVPQGDGSFRGLLQGSLGNSLWRGTPVVKEMANRWPVTFELASISLVVSLLISLPIGIYSALRQDSWGDYLARSFAILCIAVPSFWLGTLAVVFPAIWWGYMPSISLTPFRENPIGNLGRFLLPSVILGLAMVGSVTRMTRTMMLEVLRQDYIRTAWAKGLRERVVVIRHALKNALIPVVTIVGIWIPILVAGTVVIEVIFGLPGLGRLLVNAVEQRDYSVVTGVMCVFGFGMVLTNLVVDLGYALLDPRIRYK